MCLHKDTQKFWYKLILNIYLCDNIFDKDGLKDVFLISEYKFNAVKIDMQMT